MKKGDYVELEFLDHVFETNNKKDKLNPVRCRARGKIIKITKGSVSLQSWESLLEKVSDYKANQEVFIILRSSIKKIVYFKKVA